MVQPPSRLPLPQGFAVTHRMVLAISAPMMLAYLSTPLLGIVDTAIIGQLGDAALIGGIGVGAAIFDFVFVSFNFLRSGTTGLTAQAFGRMDIKEQRAIYFRAALLATVLGLLVILLHKPFLQAGLVLMAPSPAVAEAVEVYFTIRVLAAPFSLINYVVLGWFLGLGKAATGLFLQTLLTGLNMALSALFVLVYDFGVAGIAWGTFCSEAAAALMGAILAQLYIKRRLGFNGLPAFRQLLERRAMLKLLSVNRDIMIRSFLLIFAIGFFTSQSARQGDIILAANTILLHFFLFGGYFLDGLATAAEQLAGRALGAGNTENFVKTVRLTSLWGLGMAGGLAAILWIFGPVFIDLMTTEANVRMSAREFLPFAALMPLLGLMAFIMDGVFIGATWTRDMRNMMMLSVALYLAAWRLLTPGLGNQGLWLAFWVLIGARGLSLFLMYQRRILRGLDP